jgi:hypothetical protein
LSADQIGVWAGFILTLMVFSYLLGDNFLYRLAVYIFVGLSAGYITMVTVESVILPWINATIFSQDVGTQIVGALPLLLGFLLLLKATKRLSHLGNLALAFIIGVGTAVALVGAISGTLLPLVGGTANSVRIDTLNGFIMVIGVVCTLLYFQYLARRSPTGEPRRGLFARTFGTVGEGFIVVTLGALYGGAILTGLAIVSERVAFILARISGG